MPKAESLDELITRRAAAFSDHLRAIAATAGTKEEIRIATGRQLASIEAEAGIKLEGTHEFTVFKGRADSVYDRVIIGYTDPSRAADRIGSRADSPGATKVVDQIKQRFCGLRARQRQPLNALFGVGFDGKHFVFVRFHDDKWDAQDPVEANQTHCERFFWAIFNLGTKGKAFTPQHLSADFGAEQEEGLARKGVRALYAAICTTGDRKAQLFLSQWKIFFGEVCGYDVEARSEKIKQLADSYEISERGLRSAELLFALHTYYALFMKLLATEVVAFFQRPSRPLKGLMKASSGARLRRDLGNLEQGKFFQEFGITNFLEGDLFGWYLSAWTAPIEKLVRDMVARLDEYNPGTLSEDPHVSRDLLKNLYHQLFPKNVRHALGEYYTPDWLAEFVLEELEYDGDPDKRVLDPACGSGTFLVMAINRIRERYWAEREPRHFDERELCRKIVRNVIGFDLNPLAVLAARTNYLIAIRGLLSRAGPVALPIYLCDSIVIPTDHRAPARNIKTSCAPLFVGRVDYVVGNPPWVNWESLPDSYRETLKPLWQRYGLFTLSGSAGRLGGGKKDLSMLFVYGAVDDYLAEGGRLGFVITQTVFKTKGAGDGFRQFEFLDGKKRVVIKPVVVHDLSDIQVFDGATNRTAIFICRRQPRSFAYPVPYYQWRGPSRIAHDQSLADVRLVTQQDKLGAVPVEQDKRTSPWLTAPQSALAGIAKVMGSSDYKAYEGVNSGGLNGCYWIRILKRLPNGDLLVENLWDVGKIKVAKVQAAIEPGLVYPLLRGATSPRWSAKPSAHVILAQDPALGRGIAEAEMQRKYPKTLAYLKQFEGDLEKPLRGSLRGRALFKRYFNAAAPFYSMYNVGPYTLSHRKVAWRYIATSLMCAVVDSTDGLVIPDHRLIFVPTTSDDESNYVAALLNSSPVVLTVDRSAVGTQLAPHLIDKLRIPRFSSSDRSHQALAKVGERCAEYVAAERPAELSAEVDRWSAKLWGLTEGELEAIRNVRFEERRGVGKTPPDRRADADDGE